MGRETARAHTHEARKHLLDSPILKFVQILAICAFKCGILEAQDSVRRMFQESELITQETKRIF